LQILLLSQHVSGTTMPIIRGSRVFIQWLLPVVLRAVVLKLLIWCVAALSSILQTGHITLSSTPDQQLEKHGTKYHRQQPLYNTLELLMMGILVPVSFYICPMTQQPLKGQGLLIIEASQSHSDTPHSVGFLWTSDRPDAETST